MYLMGDIPTTDTLVTPSKISQTVPGQIFQHILLLFRMYSNIVTAL